MTVPDKRASCRSLRPLTRSTKPPSLTRSTISTTAPQISLHDLTPDQRPPDRLDLHTHRNHRITIVLSSSSRPLANPNLHAFRCSLNASKSPPEHHYLQTPKPSSHHPSSPPLIINQSPFSHSPSDPSPALCTPSKILLPEPTQTPSLTTPAPKYSKNHMKTRHHPHHEGRRGWVVSG